MPFEPNATPVFQIKIKKGEERWSAVCRAHVRHSRVAHAADLSLSIDRERGVKGIALWLPLDLRPLRYDYCDVSGSNWFDLSQSFWTELVRSTCTEHKGLELFYYLNLKDRTLFSNPLPSSTLPAFPGQKNVSTCCQQSFFGILLNGSILPSPLCFSNLS
jgi:hypothetical protein